MFCFWCFIITIDFYKHDKLGRSVSQGCHLSLRLLTIRINILDVQYLCQKPIHCGIKMYRPNEYLFEILSWLKHQKISPEIIWYNTHRILFGQYSTCKSCFVYLPFSLEFQSNMCDRNPIKKAHFYVYSIQNMCLFNTEYIDCVIAAT